MVKCGLSCLIYYFKLMFDKYIIHNVFLFWFHFSIFTCFKDLLANDNIKIDWLFRMSFANDIAKVSDIYNIVDVMRLSFDLPES